VVDPNTMLLSRFHVPPMLAGASHSTAGVPPLRSTVLSFPAAKNARERPSGDQNSWVASSVPGNARAASVPSGRTQSVGWPLGGALWVLALAAQNIVAIGVFVPDRPAAGALVFAGCGDDDDSGGGGGAASDDGGSAGKVAVLLPDSKSSVRWETVDRPFLQQAFEAAGIEAEIQNAEGDKATQQQQAEQAITNGATVLLLVNLDSGSGAAIAANAKSQDVKVIAQRLATMGHAAADRHMVEMRAGGTASSTGMP